MPRCTKVEKKLRELEIAEMIARGVPRKDILHYSAQKWGLKKRWSEHYYYTVLNEIKDSFADAKTFIYAEIRVKYEKLYYEAFKANNYAVCRQVLSDIAKIEGLMTDKDKDDNETQERKPIALTLNLITDKEEGEKIIKKETT